MWLQNWSVTWLFWDSFMLSKHPAKFGSTGLVKVEIHRFLFVAWPLGRCVTWSCGWGPLILSHHPAKFGVYRPCESEDITFFICHVTMTSKCHVTLWMGLSILSDHPAKSGSIGLMELEIMTFVISVPIPVPIPMPRFQCRDLQMTELIKHLHRLRLNDVTLSKSKPWKPPKMVYSPLDAYHLNCKSLFLMI